MTWTDFITSELKPFKNPKKNTYEVTVIHMHGDADYFTTDVKDFGSEQDMLSFVNFMYRCIAAFPHGMGGDDGFWEVPGYDKYEDDLYASHECCDGHAVPRTITTVYYDADSIKWDVKLS